MEYPVAPPGPAWSQSFAADAVISPPAAPPTPTLHPDAGMNLRNGQDHQVSEVQVRDDGRCAQLEAQVQILQNQKNELLAQLNHAQEQLRDAWGRLERMERIQHDIPNISAPGVSNDMGVNKQLLDELDMMRHELQACRTRLSAAEATNADRESQLTQSRQRLFDEKRRSSQLEEEIRSRDAMNMSVQKKLHTERDKYAALEKDLHCLRHVCGGSMAASVVDNGGSSDGGYREKSLRYTSRRASSEASAVPRFAATVAKVNGDDELGGCCSANTRLDSHSVSWDSRLARCEGEDRSDGGSRNTSKTMSPSYGLSLESRSAAFDLLPRSDPDIWARATRVAGPSAVLVMRSPPAARDCAERLLANYRSLLVKSRGPLYQDEHVLVELALGQGDNETNASGRRCCVFEACVSNRCGQTLHQVKLVPANSDNLGYFDLHVEPATGASLWPHDRRIFRGTLSMCSPFEIGPHVILSYLLPDNLLCNVQFRLPLLITRFMAPSRPLAPRFLELWLSPEFVQAEVAFICPIRAPFLEAGGRFFYTKALELGGLFSTLDGLDSSTQSAVLASSMPQLRPSTEVLVRTELGGPRGERDLCRVAVRSANYMVSRSVARVFLEVLCDPQG